MKILIPTSVQYSHLIEPHYTLFNRNWPGQELVYLGFDEGEVPELPDNVTFHSLGTQESFGSNWTDPLIPYIESIEDPYFVVTVEDVMLMKPVDQDRADVLEQAMKDGAHKAILDSHMNWKANSFNEDLMIIHNNADYRTTLHPSIWKRKYFLRYLKRGMTAWDFEQINMHESKSDGAIIVSLTDKKDLYYTANVYAKGKPFPNLKSSNPYGISDNKLTDEMLEDFAYVLGFIND